MLMSLSLPPSPLWHRCFQEWLPWNTKTTAGNCPGVSPGERAEVEGGRQPCNNQGELFLSVSHLTAATSTLPSPWHTLGMHGGPSSQNQVLLLRGCSKTAESNAIKSCLSSDAFRAGEGRAGGTCHLWQSVIVTYKGSRCLSKGLGKPLKTRDAFKRRAPRHPEMKGSRLCCIACCCSPCNCTPFPCQSLNTA